MLLRNRNMQAFVPKIMHTYLALIEFAITAAAASS
jgi:hypothetical protein